MGNRMMRKRLVGKDVVRKILLVLSGLDATQQASQMRLTPKDTSSSESYLIAIQLLIDLARKLLKQWRLVLCSQWLLNMTLHVGTSTRKLTCHHLTHLESALMIPRESTPQGLEYQ